MKKFVKFEFSIYGEGVMGQKPLKLKAFEHLGIKKRWQICQLLRILQIQ